MSICVAQNCANEGWAAEPVLGATFCFGHWESAKASFFKDGFRLKNKDLYRQDRDLLKIYFLRSDRYIKIGSSMNPIARLKLIRSGCDTSEKPEDVDFSALECIGWFNGSRRSEARLHKQFEAHHAAGEWFRNTKDLEIEVRKMIYIGRRAAL